MLVRIVVDLMISLRDRPAASEARMHAVSKRALWIGVSARAELPGARNKSSSERSAAIQ